MARPRGGRLTKKEEGFVKDYVRTGVATTAALKNYDVKNSKNPYMTANSIASENLKKPIIQQAIEEVKKSLADRIPDDLIEKRHIELLNKREVHSFTNPDGTKESEIIDQPDTQAVSKALDMAYKLKGSYAAEKSVTLNITHNTENREKMEKIAEETASKLLDEELSQ